jgi:hypothetical protein
VDIPIWFILFFIVIYIFYLFAARLDKDDRPKQEPNLNYHKGDNGNYKLYESKDADRRLYYKVYRRYHASPTEQKSPSELH